MFSSVRYRCSSQSYLYEVVENVVEAPPDQENIAIECGQQSRCEGLIRDVPVQFKDVTSVIEFLVVDGVPDYVLIGTMELKILQTNWDLDGQVAKFRIDEKAVRV